MKYNTWCFKPLGDLIDFTYLTNPNITSADDITYFQLKEQITILSRLQQSYQHRQQIRNATVFTYLYHMSR